MVNNKVSKDAVYIIKNGKKITITPIEFGNINIIFKNGKILDIERNERLRVKDDN